MYSAFSTKITVTPVAPLKRIRYEIIYIYIYIYTPLYYCCTCYCTRYSPIDIRCKPFR